MRSPSFLRGQVSVGHVLLLNAMTIVIVAVLVYGAGAFATASPSAFQPGGSVRIASATSSSDVTIDFQPFERTILQASFSVPSGKRADVLAFLNGTVNTGPNIVVCKVVMRLDGASSGTVLAPGEMTFLDWYEAAGLVPVTRSVQGRKNSVGPGSHTLYVRGINASGENTCSFGARSLFLVANIRDA